jgi:hypothetical protein
MRTVSHENVKEIRYRDFAGNSSRVVYPDGTIYEGEWLNKCYHGQGTLEKPNFVIKGALKNGLPHDFLCLYIKRNWLFLRRRIMSRRIPRSRKRNMENKKAF